MRYIGNNPVRILMSVVLRPTLLSVGTVIRETDLQSVCGGENRYEPICNRHDD